MRIAAIANRVGASGTATFTSIWPATTMSRLMSVYTPSSVPRVFGVARC